jgi:PAS domain S-box-containing protein
MNLDPKLLAESAEDLFQNAPCGYLVTLPDGSIVKVNETLLTLTGYARDELMSGGTFQRLLSVPGRIYYDTHIGPLLQMQGYVREVAFDLRCSNGTALAIVLNADLNRDEKDHPRLIRMTIFDATDRRKYERELLLARQRADESTKTERMAREDAERATRAKDDFLALVSHELRTPLSAILGWTQLLQKQAAGMPHLERGLGVIERNSRLQARLVEDLLDMSRIVSGKLRLEVQQVDLSNVIESALETARPAAEARTIRLRTVLDPSIVVAGDPGRLQQVFWNLLSNSVKFTPKGGEVRVVVERVNSHAEISVVDTGQGMSAEFLRHAFERFRQSDSADTRASAGLGLGLSLVKHLVEMHGGSIEARSEGEGRGSTFVVKLPAIAVERVGSEDRVYPKAILSGRVAAANISLAGVKLLIVDDDRDSRELLRHVLADRGAEVVSAQSSAEALEMIERHCPDVLVSDIGMPNEDGYVLIRRVRMLGETAARMPAIALTALSRLEDRTRALLAGYQSHLAKPVDPNELTLTVASLVGRLGSVG